ncbi:Rieske (2Fe-2S) protein [Streptomyces roseoverticillatus]|uniref:aromatic ring-hydroxylating oxygenase subunit alpha n=1 Tax=Streptomyces roseoverticillatus TaxID=66429 RepID=UPI001F28BDE3|nr:Rieske 2Fe-2S domain-containing protein [Streptomyces roseoverticillatus]MCF3106944.1 Rieske (2Fe-2S) protein [Streptomyces roseoverticillatus]
MNEAEPSGQADMSAACPNTWLAVAFSEEVKPASVVTTKLAGQDIVLYRTNGGELRAVNPHCPHLGAHLGRGGSVEGELIICPFHRMAFASDGTCIRTGWGAPAPKIRLTTHPVQERNGLVLVWHHAEGAPPTWEVPPVETTGFSRPSTWTGVFTAHPLDLSENTVDYQHFVALHGAQSVVETSPIKPVKHHLMAGFTMKGFYFSWAQVNVHLNLYDPGYAAVWLEMPALGLKALEIAAWSPIGPRRMQARKITYANIALPGALVSRLLATASPLLAWVIGTASVRQLKKDEEIWADRQYLPNPKVTQGDGPVPTFRRWAAQFY